MSRMKASKIPRRPPRRFKPPRPGQPPGNTSTPSPAPPAPDLPTRDSSRKSFEREPNRLWKRKNSEQSFAQWWWNTKLDSNDREMFNFMWLMMGAPLFLVAVASNGNILLVLLLTVWSARVLLVSSRTIIRKAIELAEEHQSYIKQQQAKPDQARPDRERGTDHTTGW